MTTLGQSLGQCDLDTLTPTEQYALAVNSSRSTELHLLALLNHHRHGGSLNGAAGESGLTLALQSNESTQRILEQWQKSILGDARNGAKP